MDMQTLATTVTTCLAPALPYLVKASEKGAEAVGGKLGAGVWETAKAIWQRLGSSPSVEAAAQEVAKAPDDEDARIALRYQIKKLLAADDSLAVALAQLLEAAARPTSAQAGVQGAGAIAQGPGAVAAGKGGVAVGGGVQGDVRIGGKE